eukprot:CAMPEP_0202457454 /NCGR_PEP_ID=MMETSP1360-20130828/14481_1 /ASSEMBLY_ACC=CAM_ASM_000848 /TAXON_ID=515479 /ORGANISM="Licmophora paradoxa, Strain CCMP2313" /LENGTH=118 /DNA_ID=CAMNT_0049077555 /DNA_START=296 /DNA_END=652 /DNA_ORIENTATION=+
MAGLDSSETTVYSPNHDKVMKRCDTIGAKSLTPSFSDLPQQQKRMKKKKEFHAKNGDNDGHQRRLTRSNFFFSKDEDSIDEGEKQDRDKMSFLRQEMKSLMKELGYIYDTNNQEVKAE